MSILRAAMILGAGALGAALGYAQGRMDAVREKVEYHRLEKDNPEYTLKNDLDQFVKKTADTMSIAKDKILNSREFDNLTKSFTREELMHLLCNSQVFDTVIDILKQNNGEFRPGYYFKKDEWDKYLKQKKNPLNPNNISMGDFDPYKAMQATHQSQQCSNSPIPPHMAQAFGPNPPSCYPPPYPNKPENIPGAPPTHLPVSDKSWEELQKSGAPIPLNTIIPRTSAGVKKDIPDEPRVTETDGSKITVTKNK